MGRERHHMIPLSYQGRDHESNIMYVTTADHVHIHQTLNLSRKRWGNIMRSFRKKHNPGTRPTRAMVDDIVRMQREYFQNFSDLRGDLQQYHCKVMYSVACHECELANMHKPNKKVGSYYMQFNHYMDIMHTALYAQLRN